MVWYIPNGVESIDKCRSWAIKLHILVELEVLYQPEQSLMEIAKNFNKRLSCSLWYWIKDNL